MSRGALVVIESTISNLAKVTRANLVGSESFPCLTSVSKNGRLKKSFPMKSELGLKTADLSCTYKQTDEQQQLYK